MFMKITIRQRSLVEIEKIKKAVKNFMPVYGIYDIYSIGAAHGMFKYIYSGHKMRAWECFHYLEICNPGYIRQMPDWVSNYFQRGSQYPEF